MNPEAGFRWLTANPECFGTVYFGLCSFGAIRFETELSAPSKPNCAVRMREFFSEQAARTDLKPRHTFPSQYCQRMPSCLALACVSSNSTSTLAFPAMRESCRVRGK